MAPRPDEADLDSDRVAPNSLSRRRAGAAAAAAAATTASSAETAKTRQAVWSSGVPFFPPSDKYWRIGRKWYDFTDFLDKHPGGPDILKLARDRFEDATFVFEAHHHNYPKARAIIRKYELSEEQVNKLQLNERPRRPQTDGASRNSAIHYDRDLDRDSTPQLLEDTAFYSVVRKRVTAHLRKVGHPDGGPTLACIFLFWAVFVFWAGFGVLTWETGSFRAALAWGFAGAWLGAFGHNWIHIPKYRKWGWALLSLDTVGFSSESWYREHVLQHHMYTNTPWDNHFRGTDPFLVTDPTVERNCLQRYVTPILNPLLLTFGIYANYTAHTVGLIKGEETLSIGKLFLPLEIAAMVARWGALHGLLLMYTAHALIGVYYFTLALMNHNAEHCVNVEKRNKSTDWGEAQLRSSADWGVSMNFWQAGVYLWLNYHTVHHLFPRVDFSHHPAIQQILIRTCEEHGIPYETAHPVTIYKEMVQSFAGRPTSLFREISVYGGGI